MQLQTNESFSPLNCANFASGRIPLRSRYHRQNVDKTMYRRFSRHLHKVNIRRSSAEGCGEKEWKHRLWCVCVFLCWRRSSLIRRFLISSLFSLVFWYSARCQPYLHSISRSNSAYSHNKLTRCFLLWNITSEITLEFGNCTNYL